MKAKDLWIGVAVLCTVLGVPVLTVAALTWMGTVHGWGLALLALVVTVANITASALVTLIFALRKPDAELKRQQRWGRG